MADEESMTNGDADHAEDIQQDKDKAQKKTAKHDSGVADLEKVTDYAEEKEISSQDISGVSKELSSTYCLHYNNNNFVVNILRLSNFILLSLLVSSNLLQQLRTQGKDKWSILCINLSEACPGLVSCAGYHK